jgi:hypothetical protein
VTAFVKVVRWIDEDGGDRLSIYMSDELKQVEALGLVTYAQLRMWEMSQG